MTSLEVLVEPSQATVEPPARPTAATAVRAKLGAIGGVAAIAAQILLVLLVIRSFRLMPGGWDLLKLTAVGFVVHALLPMRYRVGFFIALSTAAVLMVFGFGGGAQLIAIGLLLIAICHLPIAWATRVGLLVLAGGALAIGRAGLIDLPLGTAIWPILASMFMFRLIIYMYDI